MLAGLLTTFVSDAGLVMFLLAVEGFCGGVLMPAVTGIMLN
jgi:predicted CDP-diglyceride synthetase/phosphatidate cytidylyltransferase